VLTCPSLDRNGDGRIAIEELVKTVDAALAGCEHVAGGVADGADLRQ
jgi:hypothetical protein